MKILYTTYLLRVIGYFSLLFYSLNFIYLLAGYEGHRIPLFIISVIITFFAFICNEGVGKKGYLCLLAYAIPLVGLREIHEISYLVIALLASIYFMVMRKDVKASHNAAISEIKIGIIINLIILWLTFGYLPKGSYGSYLAVYLILYIISYIIVLRNLRHYHFEGSIQEIEKFNYKYGGILILVALFFSSSFATNLLMIAFNTFKHYTGGIFYNIFLAIGYIVMLIYHFFKWLGRGYTGEEVTPDQGMMQPSEMGIYEMASTRRTDMVFYTLMAIVAALVVLWIVRRKTRSNLVERRQEGYTEVKEAIKKTSTYSINPFKKIVNYLKPKTNEERIRKYYKSFIEKCKNNSIEIKISDTTLDINNKAMNVFNPKAIDVIREVYIKVRYGKSIADEHIYKTFLKHYKEIKSEKK